MIGNTLIAFSALFAMALAGGYGHDSAAVVLKQDTHAFSYKVQEANHRAYAAPAVVHHGYGHGHGYGYAHAAPAVIANTVGYAAAPVAVAKSISYAAAPVVAAGYHHGHHDAGYYQQGYAAKPYAFGYSYGAASPTYGHGYGYQQHGGLHHGYAAPHHY